MVVEPAPTRYTMRSGSDANVGITNLCLQRRSNTSSANPKKIIQHMHSNAQRKWANWRDKNGAGKKWRDKNGAGNKNKCNYCGSLPLGARKHPFPPGSKDG